MIQFAANMAKNRGIDPIPAETFKRLVGAWAKVVVRNESALVYHFSRADMWWRLKQMEVDPGVWTREVGEDRWPLVLDLVGIPFEDAGDVRRWLEGKPVDLPLFVLGGERLFKEKLASVWSSLAREARVGRSVLVFTHTDITSDGAIETMGDYYEVAQNVVIDSLYNLTDAKQFIEYLEDKWSVVFPEKLKIFTLKMGGGHIGLVKQILRFWRDDNEIFEDVLSNQAIRVKLMLIWQAFNSEQQRVISDSVMGVGGKTETPNSRVRDFLARVGWLERNWRGWRLTVPMLGWWLKARGLEESTLSVGDDHQLEVNGVVVDRQFSKHERKILKLMLASKGVIVSREAVAQAIWGADWEEKYSDWAIDQLVSRLRKRVAAVGMGRDCLKTVRGKGIVWMKG